MSDYYPIAFVFLFGVITFLSASKNGVVKLLASGLAAGLALLVLFMLFRILPVLGEDFGGVGLTWKVVVGISVAVSLVVYIIARVIFGMICKTLFGEESFLHNLVDGIPGGILSLLPTVVVGFFLFTCVRIAGTLQELNYVATLAQPGIEAVGRRIPPYPLSSRWRRGIESVPFLAFVMDLTDPFSDRGNRNVAAALMIQQSPDFKAFALTQPETGNVVENAEIANLVNEVEVYAALEKQDRIGLVTNPDLQEVAVGYPRPEELKTMNLEIVVKGFVEVLEEKRAILKQNLPN